MPVRLPATGRPLAEMMIFEVSTTSTIGIPTKGWQACNLHSAFNYKSFDPIFRFLLSCHNRWILLQLFKYLYRIANDGRGMVF